MRCISDLCRQRHKLCNDTCKNKDMKVGFPLMNENELANDFAHSKYIGICDVSTGLSEIMPIDDTLGNERSIFDSLLQNNLKLVISPFYSFMSLRVFKENKISTYKAKGRLVDENLLFLKSGKMKPFDIYESLLTGECARDCLGCSPEESCEH
jgi:predicted Fe-Mo cluster-binding NifX family protein